MQGLNLKGQNVADADLVAILSCISKIEKLSGIEEIILERNSRVKISLLVEIVKKIDEPVIMKTNYEYFLFLIYNQSSQIFHYTRCNTPKRVTSLWGPSPRHCARATQLLSKKCRSGSELLAILCPI